MEPFRPVVDELVVATVTGGRIKWGEFKKRKRDGAMLLVDEARKRYLQAYEEPIYYPQVAGSADHFGPAADSGQRTADG